MMAVVAVVVLVLVAVVLLASCVTNLSMMPLIPEMFNPTPKSYKDDQDLKDVSNRSILGFRRLCFVIRPMPAMQDFRSVEDKP